jgi:glucose repression regulatory protein TUP1
MNHGYPSRAPIPPGQGAMSARLNELLDSIRQEFDSESQRSVEYENQGASLPKTEPQG